MGTMGSWVFRSLLTTRSGLPNNLPTTLATTFLRRDAINSILCPGSCFLILVMLARWCLCQAPQTNWHWTRTVMCGSLNPMLTALVDSILRAATYASIPFQPEQVCRPSTPMGCFLIHRSGSGSRERAQTSLVD